MPGGQSCSEQFLVRRGLGRGLNKQKMRRSAEAEMRIFRIWRAISIACDLCRGKVCGHICIACHYYTKFGIIVASNAYVATNLAATQVASNAYGAPYAKNAHFRFGGSAHFLFVEAPPQSPANKKLF